MLRANARVLLDAESHSVHESQRRRRVSRVQNFSQVNLHANKAMSLLDTMDDQDETVRVTRAKLACARGIADLRLGRFKEAATRLTEIPVEIGTTFANVCAAKDVATYGTLCALASFDREELRSVLSNTRTGAFRAHLEAAADLREVLHNFYNSKYTGVLFHLDNVRSTLALDIHLGAHIDALYECIRDRALIQYVKPYVTVDLAKSRGCFQCDDGGDSRRSHASHQGWKDSSTNRWKRKSVTYHRRTFRVYTFEAHRRRW